MTTDDMIQELMRERSNEYGGMTLATFASLIAKLRAADELATYAERHLNYSDTRIPSLIAAYRNAGEETK